MLSRIRQTKTQYYSQIINAGKPGDKWAVLNTLTNKHKTTNNILGLWLRLECSLDSLSIDSAQVIYVSEGYDVAYNRRTASQPSYVVPRVTWYVKTFRNVNYVC